MGKIKLSIRDLVLVMMSSLWEMDEDAVLEWINTKWPHCIGVTKDFAHPEKFSLGKALEP